VDYKRAGAAESGAAVELLASQPKAMKFRLMPAVRLLRFFFCYCPFVLEARHQPQACDLAYKMQQMELPSDIAVRVDPMTSAATKIAMDWAGGSSEHSDATHYAASSQGYERLQDLHPAWIRRHDRQTRTADYTHTPDGEKYDGIKMIFLTTPWSWRTRSGS
jgi:hypothetical protein